ncbi:hypothetical protein [Kiloniella sp.]|uniref:DUF7483 domain-containing protein n=1 Tax=Kiloniella sp. TaxID=1938587 RepID=UPI003A8DEC58
MRALYAGADGQWKNDLMNSLALSAGKKLTFTPSVLGNQRQFTVMCNVRRTQLGGLHYIFSGGTYCYWYFHFDDTLRWNGTAAVGAYHTTRKFRDTEWMFLGLAVDTVARTVKMVVNDEEIDLWDTQTLPTQNAAVGVSLAGTAMQIGEGEHVLSDFVLLDGEVLTPQEMVNYRTQNVPFGNNVITTTKKFTTEGTQERFWAIALNVPTSGTSIQDEGQFLVCPSASWSNIAHTEILPETGKYQVEFTQLDGTGAKFLVGTGLASSNSFTGNSINTQGNYTGMSLRGDNNCVYYSNTNNGGEISPTSWGKAFLRDDVASLFLDMDARKMYFKLNGVEPNGMSVEAGTGGADINPADVRMYFDLNNQDAGMRVNFGQTDYKYPVTGYGALKEPVKSNLKRCNFYELQNGAMCDNVNDKVFTTGAAWYTAISNFVMPTGKFYMEWEVSDVTHQIVGAGNHDLSSANTYLSLAANGDSAGMYFYNSTTTIYKDNTSTLVTTPGLSGATVIGDILQVAVDADTGKLWIGRNDVWEGDPAAGIGEVDILGIDGLRFAISVNSNTGCYYNFGDSPWKMTPPIGFKGPAELDFDSLRPSQDEKNYEYGANGCQLLFENGGALGEVTEGNLQNWTLTGIAPDDQLTDTPGDPYAVLSSIHTYGTNVAISEGGLRTTVSSTATDRGALTNIPADFPIYFEFTVGDTVADNNLGLQMCPNSGDTGPYPTGGFRWQDTGNINQNGGSAGATPAWSNDHVMMIAYSPADGMAWFGRNGSWYGDVPAIGSVGDISGLAGKLFVATNHYGTSRYLTLNFGQRPFAYTVPTGFKELKSSNLETPKFHGRDKFDVALSVGTGAPRDIPTSFDEIGLVWGKARSSAYSHRLEDRLRGAGKGLYSDITNAENTRSDSITDFTSGSFSLGNDVGSGYNENGVSYAYWIFGNDGTEVTNNDGTIPSQVIADSSGYFSIVTATADGSTGSFGHGLDDVEFSLIKSRNNVGTTGWDVWHKDLASQIHYLGLDTSNAQSSGSSNFSGAWGGVIGLNTGAMTSGAQLMAINFSSVAGLSKVFSYQGNGAIVNGPHVYCEFKPRWILLKRVDSSGAWSILDTERDTINPVLKELNPDLSSAETEAAGPRLDITAQGFTLRTTGAAYNANGGEYIGLAIADVAGGGNLPAILGN